MTEPSDPAATVVSSPGGDEAFCPECNHSYSTDHEHCPSDGAKLILLRARPDQFVGRVFDDRYEVRAPLGHGGMGTVYRGWQRSVDREVAIKVIHPKLATDRVAVKRFLREARLSSRLNQPNIINVYDFGQTDDGVLFLVMELLRGHTLASELDGARVIAIRRVVTIGLQLCDALEAAHNQGIVHRDLKPGNIVLLDEPPGRDLLKVLDFGLAKSLVADHSHVTHTSNMLGTPLYMPPEQVEGRDADPRSDLYALGCILFHMTAGRPPFVREHVGAILQAHVHEPVPAIPAGVPAPLATAIARMLQKDPAARPANAAEVRVALQEILDGGFAASEPVIATADTLASGTARRPSRRRPWIAIAFALAIAIGGAVGVVLSTRERSVAPVSVDASRPIDAAIDAAPDAAIDAAQRLIDAAVPSPDAATPTHRHPPVARPHDSMPDLPFIKKDGH